MARLYDNVLRKMYVKHKKLPEEQQLLQLSLQFCGFYMKVHESDASRSTAKVVN